MKLKRNSPIENKALSGIDSISPVFRLYSSAACSFLLLTVIVLALFSHGSMKAIGGAEPYVAWVRIVNASWAKRLVTVCTTSIRTAVSFQTGLTTAMVAGIILETSGVPFLASPFYSVLRTVKVAPSNFWTETNFQPHLPRFMYAIVLTEVLVTAASQFLSTIFLSDFASGTFIQSSNSTDVNSLNTTYSSPGSTAWWLMPPAASWTFAELSESFQDQSGFHDTGHRFRAFLPFEEEAQRVKLHQLRGPVPVMDHRVVCASPPLINLKLDATLQSYVHLSGQIPTENLTYPLLIDSDSQPFINFTCKLPTPIFQNNKTVGETSLCVPNSRTNWIVLNENPLILPNGFPEASTLSRVLDVLSTAAIIGARGNPQVVETIRTAGPWVITSNGSANIEAVRISACVTNLAMQTLTVGMNSTSDNVEPKIAWDHHTQSFNTEPSRPQLGVSSPGDTNSTGDRVSSHYTHDHNGKSLIPRQISRELSQLPSSWSSW